MSGDTFTKDRLKWLDSIAGNASLSSGAFRLAYIISGYVNRREGYAFPSLDLLAERLDVNEKSIRRSVEELVSAGYLTKRRGGSGRANRYWMQFPDRTIVSDQNETSLDKNVHSEGGRSDKSVHSESPSQDQTGHFCPSDWTFLSQQTGQKCPPNSLKELSEELSEKNISPPTPSRASLPKVKGSEESSGFEEFYQVFPRKVSKGSARKAWSKAIKLASSATIIEAARRYAIERRSEDPNYTKHPATWLNAEAWHDEPAPPPMAGAWPRSRASAKEQTGAAVAHILGHGGHSAGRRSTVDTILETLGGVIGHED